MIKKHIPLLIILTFIITMVATTSATIKEAEEFKNLQVLPKNMSEEALDSAMDHYAVSLGVKCSFCHARKSDPNAKGLDFASDTKDEKKAARYMIKMTADINGKYFNWMNSDKPDTIRAVVCYTCHRGSPHPDAADFLSLIDSTIKSHHQPAPPPVKK